MRPQKCIYEYARNRSGIVSEKFLKEPGFHTELEESQWRHYPIILGYVILMADAALRSFASGLAAALADGLVAAVSRVTESCGVPAGTAPEFRLNACETIEGRLHRASLAEPRPARDILKKEFEAFFAQLPIHASLRGHGYVLLRNNLRVNLCRACKNPLRRMDGPELDVAMNATPTSAVPADHAAG